jgi:hypothetical protein
VIRIRYQADGAGIVVDEQNLLPRLASISGLEDPAVKVRREHMAHRCYIDNVRVFLVDHDRADGARLTQTAELPGLARIS